MENIIFTKATCDCIVHYDSHLINCIKWHYNGQVKSMLNEHLANLPTNCREILLHHAAAYCNVEIIRFVVASGVPVDCMAQAGRTALMIAVELDHDKAVIELLESGADIDITDSKGESALYIALHRNVYKEIIDTLILRAKSKVSTTEVLVEKLLGYDCSFPYFVLLRDSDVLKALLRQGFDVKAINIRQETALHLAAWVNELDLVKLLIDRGSDVNAVDVCGIAPINFAARNLNPAMIELLLESNANPQPTGTYYETIPLYEVLVEGNSGDDKRVSQCAELLVRSGYYYSDPRSLISAVRSDYNDIFRSYRLNSFVAHYALIEMLGIASWEDETHLKGFSELKDYYNKCRDTLKIIIVGTMTLLDLVGGFSEYGMRHRARDQNFVYQVKQSCNSRPELKEKYSYYINVLIKRVDRAARMVKLENEAIPVICDIFDSNYNQLHVFARRVVQYLSDADLEKLSQM